MRDEIEGEMRGEDEPALASTPARATDASAGIDAKTGVDAKAKGEGEGETRGKMPRTIGIFMWAVILASFALSATTWISLGELAGFHEAMEVKGVTLRLAWLMPVVVDGYVVVALMTWMAPVPTEVARFARNNTYGAAVLGTVTQSLFHTSLGWIASHNVLAAALAAVIGAMPPGFAAGAIHLRTIVIRRTVVRFEPTHATHATDATPAAQVEHAPAPRPAPKASPEARQVEASPAPKAKAGAARAPRAPRAKASASASGEADELASHRIARQVAALDDAWGESEPTGARGEAARILNVSNVKAQTVLSAWRAHRAELGAGGEATEATEATEAAL